MTTTDETSPTILLTGFEPFGGEDTNPSWAAVQRVARDWSGPGALHILELPVDFGAVDAALTAALERHRPDVVLCVGQAGGSAALAVERVAVNVDDARIADNAGRRPVDEPILADGPAAYFATLPIKAAVAELAALGIPAVVSDSAGTFTCNHALYRLLHEISLADRRMLGGFVHVPYSPEQVAGGRHPAGTPSMSVETMARGIAAVLRVTLASR